MLSSFKIGTWQGAIGTVILSSLIVFILFNKHIREASQVSFASGGDGLKSTFGSIYHIRYDSSYWHFQGMNYPFGESVFYTGNQTFLTNIIKLAKDGGWDVSGSTLGILNLWLLISFVLCALFLYLIMKELDLPSWYALLGSLGITFLTPQWDRMGGHYNLAYAYVFPVAIYLLIRFYKKPTWFLSVLFSMFVIIIAGKHVYYIPLVGTIWFVYWVFLLINRKRLYGKNRLLLLHLFVQFLLPVALFSLFAASMDPNHDRTAYPWGFYESISRFREVFLPVYRPYGRWLQIGSFKTMKYVGGVSSLVFFSLPLIMVKNWIVSGKSSVFRLSDSFILNVLILGGMISLVISMGFPFTLGLEHWLNFTGPFRQFREIGRFIFPFFYIVNIFSLYIIWKWWERVRDRSLWVTLVLMLALLWNGYDAWFNMSMVPGKTYNKFEALNDQGNLLAENQWVSNHDWSGFQALMPMPYYHIGSENYWLNESSPVIEHSYIASLKTGLPLNSAMLSRTSIGQTLLNLDLIWEPTGRYEVLREYDPEKPLLIARHRNGNLNRNEARILDKSILIDSNNHLLFYALYPDSLIQVQLEYASHMAGRLRSCLSDPAGPWYYFESFDSLAGGHFEGEIAHPAEFLSYRLPDSGSYNVSFWYEGAGKDLWPRTNLTIILHDSARTVYSYLLTDFFRETVLRDGDRALISFPVHVHPPGYYLSLSYRNPLPTRGMLTIDRVLVRKESSDVAVTDGADVLINNRNISAASDLH